MPLTSAVLRFPLLVLGVLLAAPSNAVAQTATVTNLVEHTDEDPPIIAELEVRRHSRVRIANAELVADPQASRQLHIELFPDVSVRAVRNEPGGLTTAGRVVTWVGVIEGVADSAVRITLAPPERDPNGPRNLTILAFAPLGIFRVQIAPDAGSNQTRYIAQELVMAGEGTETNRFSVIPFLEGTDVFWTLERGNSFKEIIPNKLEANIFPHLVVAQNYSDVLNIDKQERRGVAGLKEFAYSISGTPAVRIRMLRLRSAPVRTPSYMPRGNLQLLWVRGLKDCDPLRPADEQADHCRRAIAKAGMKAAEDAQQSSLGRVHAALSLLPRVSIWESHVIVGHHSNGQDGCLNTSESRDPAADFECRPITPLTADTINFKDGSFSTNYYRVGLNWSRHRLVGPEAVRESRIMGEFEHHPRAWVDERMADLYGRVRFNFLGSYALRDVPGCKKRFELMGTTTINPTVVDGVQRVSGTVQTSCFPATNGGWGFFARFYTGQDYYNVGFLTNIKKFHAGMTFNQSGFFRFRRSSTVNR